MLPWVTVITVAFLITTSRWARVADWPDTDWPNAGRTKQAKDTRVISQAQENASFLVDMNRMCRTPGKKFVCRELRDCRITREKGQREIRIGRFSPVDLSVPRG